MAGSFRFNVSLVFWETELTMELISDLLSSTLKGGIIPFDTSLLSIAESVVTKSFVVAAMGHLLI